MPAVTTHVLPQPAPEAKVIVRIELPESLYDTYTAAGASQPSPRNTEQEILERLKRCQHYTAARPLYFDDAGRAEIERAIGHLAVNEQDVLVRLTQLLQLTVDKIKITLEPKLQTRIRTRCFKKPYKEVLEKAVIHGLRVFAGLEPQ